MNNGASIGALLLARDDAQQRTLPPGGMPGTNNRQGNMTDITDEMVEAAFCAGRSKTLTRAKVRAMLAAALAARPRGAVPALLTDAELWAAFQTAEGPDTSGMDYAQALDANDLAGLRAVEQLVLARAMPSDDTRRLDWLAKQTTCASDTERYLPRRIYWGGGERRTIREVIDCEMAREINAAPAPEDTKR